MQMCLAQELSGTISLLYERTLHHRNYFKNSLALFHLYERTLHHTNYFKNSLALFHLYERTLHHRNYFKNSLALFHLYERTLHHRNYFKNSLALFCYYMRGLYITGTILSGLLFIPGKESLRRGPPFSPPLHLNVPSEVCSRVAVNIQNMSCHYVTFPVHYYFCFFVCLMLFLFACCL